MRCARERAKTRGAEWSEYGKRKQQQNMEEITYEYEERGVGDGKSARGDLVSV